MDGFFLFQTKWKYPELFRVVFIAGARKKLLLCDKLIRTNIALSYIIYFCLMQ
jgi:hypothetical protein